MAHTSVTNPNHDYSPCHLSIIGGKQSTLDTLRRSLGTAGSWGSTSTFRIRPWAAAATMPAPCARHRFPERRLFKPTLLHQYGVSTALIEVCETVAGGECDGGIGIMIWHGTQMTYPA
jgi:hypothetical protein